MIDKTLPWKPAARFEPQTDLVGPADVHPNDALNGLEAVGTKRGSA